MRREERRDEYGHLWDLSTIRLGMPVLPDFRLSDSMLFAEGIESNPFNFVAFQVQPQYGYLGIVLNRLIPDV